VQRLALPIALLAVTLAGAAFLLLRGQEHGGPDGPFFGVNAPLLRDYALDPGDGRLDALASSMEDAGIEWARFSFDQNVEQRQPSQINWSLPDRVVGALAEHGIRVLPLFVGTAAWAADPAVLPTCGSRSYPSDVKAYSRFVGAAVARYGRGGDYWSENSDLPELPIEIWEIGNEENLINFWCPAANPRQYAALYSASRTAVLAEDEDAEVIVGGLAPVFGPGTPEGSYPMPEFLKEMLTADSSLARKIPAVAIHPYMRTPREVLQLIGVYREAMAQAGLGDTPMIITELGWYTRGVPGPQLATEQERASRIAETVSIAWRTNCNVIGFGVHSWVTAEQDPNDHEDWYGLADPVSGEANDSGSAYGDAISAIRSGDSDRSTVDAC
jgi:hypothetical protein